MESEVDLAGVRNSVVLNAEKKASVKESGGVNTNSGAKPVVSGGKSTAGKS